MLLDKSFDRVQILPGLHHDNVQIGSIACSQDSGKIAAAYGQKIVVFEPSPLAEDEEDVEVSSCWIYSGDFVQGDSFFLLLGIQEGMKHEL